MRGQWLESQAGVERERADVVRRCDQVEPWHTTLPQCGDEGVDEPATPALSLQLGEQVDVQVRGIALRVRLASAP